MRAVGVYTAVLSLVTASLVGAGLAAPPPAEALTPPVAITADELPSWQTNGIVWALAESGGVVFAGGTFSAVRPPGAAAGTEERSAVNFAALDAATGEPTDCALSFTVGSGTATVRALAVSPDGRTLYAGGLFGAVNGVPVSSLAAIDIDSCTPRSDFRPSVNATVRSLAVTDDTVYLGGDFTSVGGQPRRHFAAVSTSGAALPWRADADEPGRAVELTPDGDKVLLGGDFFTIDGADSHALAVVDARTGEVVKNYPLGFIPRTSVVKDITTDATGFYTANEGTGGGVFDGRIALDLDSLEQRWRDTCLGATQALVVYKSVLYSGSHAHDCSSMGAFPNQERRHLLAESVDDPTLLGWFPDTNDGIGEQIGPRAMTLSSSGSTDYLWVGGEFTTVGGGRQQGLTRFASGPDTGAPSVPQTEVASVRPGEVTVRWQSSLDLDDSELTYRVYRNGSSEPVHTTSGSSLPWARPQLTFTDTDVSPGSTYTYRVTASDGANTSEASAPRTVTAAATAESYPEQVVADGAQLYWRYDEPSGTYAADASGADDSGVHRGGPERAAAPGALPGGGTAVGHDGTDSYTYSDRRHDSPSAYTIETWFRTDTTEGGMLAGFGDRVLQPSATHDKHLYMTDDGRLVFGVFSGWARTVSTSAAYNDGAWHHVAATQGADGMRLYVDGEQQAADAQITDSRRSPGYWRFGGDSLENWPDRPSSDHFRGQLDESAVYPSALGADRIAAHHRVGTASADTAVTLQPVADTYVNEAAPNANHGTHQQLAVRGSPGYVSYLRFALPDAPPGQQLKAATLRVRTSSDAAAGSTDDIRIVPVTGRWSESETTYGSRPALAEEPLGTLRGATATSTTYSTALDTGALTAALGEDLDLALTCEGGDSLWLYARESTGNGTVPQLLLTFGAS
ncbi:LamG-like jellyroll fold domain-containing protein [Streptomyces sp. TP-A0874]|uniref:LamG-like jellyroll fold domain-containing protein n=1 Tax=Streptomyces sp. TP-A0874 TaxID=549819 RepID=UPI000852CADC|nr:LamG-like jellyroll fold domain-containing protein [Streptomyces sp. TP-A0874]